MDIQLNQSLSVDCVVFGYSGSSLKVMLMDHHIASRDKKLLKLPGAMIQNNETLPQTANRVLLEMVGLSNLYLQRVDIFSDPQRLTQEEIAWVNNFYGVNARRVVTVGYYTLVKLDSSIVKNTTAKGAQWVDVEKVNILAMDHKKLLTEALGILYREILQSPIAFELLPKKFTITELQNLYSVMLGVEIDKRNFRKKITAAEFIIATDEKEKGVAHKPAQYYRFSKSAYDRAIGRKNKLNFINNWMY